MVAMNRIIKQTDFLAMSAILSIIFGITSFLNKEHLIVTKKHAFFSTHGWKNNNSTKETLLSRHYGKITDGMSACLLVKDENNNLPEWIAYHYHNLPLRYLVVAVDPNR